MSLTIFSKKFGSVLRCSSQWLCFKGANQLQVFYIRLCETSKDNFSTKAVVLKCIPSNFFLEICRIFRTTSEKLALENYVLKRIIQPIRITPRFCKLSSLVFCCVFSVLYQSKSQKYNVSLRKEVGYNLIYWPEC